MAEGRTRTGWLADYEEKMGLDWPHPTESTNQHHPPVPDLELPREQEERESAPETAGDATLIWKRWDPPGMKLSGHWRS